MTATPASFREAFNAFKDDNAFTSANINYWLTLGYKLHNADRFGDVLDDVVMLYAAHNITLEAQSAASNASGQQPGAVLGPITSASVDKVSYSRDSSKGADPSEGHWNLTTYGSRWKSLMGLFGAGPLHVGAPSPGDAGGLPYTPAVW